MYFKVVSAIEAGEAKPGEKLDSFDEDYFVKEKKTNCVLPIMRIGAGDLLPADTVISNLIDLAVIDFLTRFWPCSFEVSVPIESDKGDDSKLGVQAARDGEYEAAAGLLRRACDQYPGKDEILFAYAVVLEKLGRYDEALKQYRLALQDDDDEQLYAECLERLETFKDRLVQAQPEQADQPDRPESVPPGSPLIRPEPGRLPQSAPVAQLAPGVFQGVGKGDTWTEAFNTARHGVLNAAGKLDAFVKTQNRSKKRPWR